MSQPWLEDLDDDWIVPSTSGANANANPNTTDHASSVRQSQNQTIPGLSRIPRGSSGVFSQPSSAKPSSQKRRSPLCELNDSQGNNAERSGSTGSVASVVYHDSVRYSPTKQQATLEWKKRLVHGEVGYGDQTDLFGPSSLENMFQSPARPSSSRPTSSNNPSKLAQHPRMPPSSPPPWPSQIDSPSAQGTCPRPVQADDSAYSCSTVDNSTYSCDQDDSRVPSPSQLHFDHSNSHVPSPSQLQFDNSAASALRTRTISGHTDLSGEGFSPVFISKHTTSNGQISYAALDPRSTQRSNASAAADQPVNRDPPSTPNSRIHYEYSAEHTFPSVPEVSLPDNLPTGTPPMATLASFVSLDSPPSPSISASFNRHKSSSSQSATVSSRHHSEAGEEPIPSPKQSSPVKVPATPGKNEESSLLSPPKTRPSQSPLKIFGNYDTFTNNRLLRRMSQLEGLDPDVPLVSETGRNITNRSENPFHDSLDSSRRFQSVGTDSSRRLQSVGTGSSRRFQSVGTVSSQIHRVSQQRAVSNLSSFGEGELDDHDFEADLSFPSGLDLDATIESSEGSPPPEAVPPGSIPPFRFHLESSPEMKPQLQPPPFKLKRKLSRRSNTAKSRCSDDGLGLDQLPIIEPDDASEHKEGKRPRSSPSKAPTPKRRRTLVALDGKLPGMGNGSEIHVKITGDAPTTRPPPPITIHPSSVRSRRDVTRPRNPTPSQRRREQLQAEIGEATLEYLEASPELSAIKETFEQSELPEDAAQAEQAKAVAAEVAAFTLNVSRVDSDGERKRSITTQDFLDEAMHIMTLIRAKGRPSNLGSVEESEEAEKSHPEDVSSISPLRLSRPPSREGRISGWRTRSQTQYDPNVADHLQKFREDENVELVESSLRKFHVDDSQALEFDDEELQNAPVIDPMSAGSHAYTYSDASQEASPTKTHGSHPSIDSSSDGRTVGTSSSRKSDFVANLSPEKVAHLIPEEVAGMTFDKDKQRWVRMKASKRVNRDYLQLPGNISCEDLHPTSHISSEDDPFGNIPDLTVDEVKELNRIQGFLPGYSENDRSVLDYIEEHVAQPYQARNEVQSHGNEAQISRPTTRDSHVANPFTSSTAPSKYSVFASSQHQFDTRATSWSNEDLANLARAKHQQQQQVQTGDGLRDLAAVNVPDHISEATEVVHDETLLSQDDSLLQEDPPLQEDSETEELPAPKQREPAQQPWYQPSPQNAYRGGARHVSLRRQTLERGFSAMGQDQGEMSFIATLPDKRLMSLSVSVSKPPTKPSAPSQEYPGSSPTKMDGTFYLSDLPEFTVNEVDEERPSEKALARRVARHNTGDRYAMAVQSLVKTLTDVEPDEPYWEDIKQLNLRERGLDSVHNLEDFCARLEDLDLSGNNVAHLEGAPNSIRRLNLRSNALSSLTAWSHLMNLQYLDISNNSIENLGGLCMLVHLRELCADDNHIANLDGIMAMDGLLKLSVRRNRLLSVDFEGCQLKRLEDLDLSGNQLSCVSGIQGLASLERLILDDNELGTFEAVEDSTLRNPKIACLSLHNNRISSLNVSRYTKLRYLNVDENHLSTIQGLEYLRHLDTLSMRKQSPKESSNTQVSIFEQRLYARSLFLSSNIIPTIELPHSYHSVQNLELASCGLKELPVDFGLRFPNLRTLNVSFNSLNDLRPLLNISRLEKLHASSNRIARLRKTVAVLARMAHMRKADLRDNPITHGFYAPVAIASIEKSLISIRSYDLESQSEAQVQQRASSTYLLPIAELATDNEHLARLDEDTKLRRRVYEIMLSSGCKKLNDLDGLGFARDKAMLRDGVWERLVKLGVVKKSGSKGGDDTGASRQLAV